MQELKFGRYISGATGYVYIDVSPFFGHTKKHITVHYGELDDVDPMDYDSYAPVRIDIVGHYRDYAVECFICELRGRTVQIDSPTLLHITLSVSEGFRPVDSGKRATEHFDEIVYFDTPISIEGRWRVRTFGDDGTDCYISSYI